MAKAETVYKRGEHRLYMLGAGAYSERSDGTPPERPRAVAKSISLMQHASTTANDFLTFRGELYTAADVLLPNAERRMPRTVPRDTSAKPSNGWSPILRQS